MHMIFIRWRFLKYNIWIGPATFGALQNGSATCAHVCILTITSTYRLKTSYSTIWAMKANRISLSYMGEGEERKFPTPRYLQSES